ncbi:MFS transporter [Halogranum rubrum]|nr:MFS transporter [Halogranum salarium]
MSSPSDTTRPTPGAGTEESDSWLRHWGPAIAVSLAMFVGVIDSTLMNVAIPAIVLDLDTTVAVVQGAIAFYSMVIAALILPGGKLASMFPIRRLLRVTLVVYGIGTLLAAVSWNVVVLYVGWSFIEGAAAAVLLPLTFTVLIVSYEGRDRAKALGILAGVNATGTAVGPIVGGALTTFASWRWGFALEVLVVLVTLWFVRYLPDTRLSDEPERLDLGGTVLSVVAVVALVAGFILSSRYGWLLARRPFAPGGVQLNLFGTSPTVWLVGFGLLTFAAFVQYERRVAERGGSPLVPLYLLRNAQLTAGVATNTIRSLVLAAFIFVIPVFLQSAVGYSAFEAGLAMLPFSAATLVASTLTTGWRQHVSPRTLVQAGTVLMGVGLLWLVVQTSLSLTILQLVLPMATFGLGLGLVMAQLIDMTLSAVDTVDSSAASGVLNATSMLGYALGTAVVGAYLLRGFYENVVDGVLSATGTPISQGERNDLVVALEDAIETATAESQQAFLAQLTPTQQEVLRGVFDAAMLDAQRGTLLLLTLLVLVMLLSTTLLPQQHPVSTPSSPHPDSSVTPSLDTDGSTTQE